MPERLFDKPAIERPWPGSSPEDFAAGRFGSFVGDQRIYRFANGLGASLVQIQAIAAHNRNLVMPFTGVHPVTEEALWEVLVVIFNSDDDTDFSMCFDTPVADDPIRNVTKSQAELILREIKELPIA